MGRRPSWRENLYFQVNLCEYESVANRREQTTHRILDGAAARSPRAASPPRRWRRSRPRPASANSCSTATSPASASSTRRSSTGSRAGIAGWRPTRHQRRRCAPGRPSPGPTPTGSRCCSGTPPASRSSRRCARLHRRVRARRRRACSNPSSRTRRCAAGPPRRRSPPHSTRIMAWLEYGDPALDDDVLPPPAQRSTARSPKGAAMTTTAPTVGRCLAPPAMFALLAGPLLSMIDSNVVNVAVPHIADDLGTARSPRVQWTVSGYLLALAAALPATSYLSKRHGTVRVYAISLAAFTLASAACAFAGDVGAADRVPRGAGRGGRPARTAGDEPALRLGRRRRPATSRWRPALALFLGPALGPTVGGLLRGRLGLAGDLPGQRADRGGRVPGRCRRLRRPASSIDAVDRDRRRVRPVRAGAAVGRPGRRALRRQRRHRRTAGGRRGPGRAGSAARCCSLGYVRVGPPPRPSRRRPARCCAGRSPRWPWRCAR